MGVWSPKKGHGDLRAIPILGILKTAASQVRKDVIDMQQGREVGIKKNKRYAEVTKRLKTVADVSHK